MNETVNRFEMHLIQPFNTTMHLPTVLLDHLLKTNEEYKNSNEQEIQNVFIRKILVIIFWDFTIF